MGGNVRSCLDSSKAPYDHWRWTIHAAYWKPALGSYSYRCPLLYLNDFSELIQIVVAGESDGNGIVYGGSVETDSIFAFDPANGTVQTYVRDPRID